MYFGNIPSNLAERIEKDAVIKVVTETKGIKPWMFLIAKLATLGFVVASVNDWINDDEDYAQLTDYQKQSNYLLKVGDGRFIKIPKGRSVSSASILAGGIITKTKSEDVNWGECIITSIFQNTSDNPFSDIYKRVAHSCE